ncbi:D-ribose pyranase [Chryseomicrobium excrementi]|uniref:D-ribose pyranase n=1 Tax=Chryseomicrobium excrementi TaxID=2041346 RepID=A0A2M9F0L7_9BACL|nr:D-ribose pyranase [Chryseomicrobium excrementi]PJK17008.1 D-ribose pyranase [Chryseomicrobium excrementi]
MKKQGILNRELAGILAKMGHTDQLVIADCGLPIPSGVRCIDLSYTLGKPTFLDIVEAVTTDFQAEKAIVANELSKHNEPVHQELDDKFELTYISHEELKELSKQAKVIIRTGEATPYANIVLQSGVIF